MLSKKFIIKIPKDIKIIYQEKKNLLLIISSTKKTILNLDFKIIFLKNRKSIYLTNIASSKLNNVDKKNKKSSRQNNVNKIKISFLDSLFNTNIKLKIVGIGYKVFLNDKIKNLLKFKLGYSHFVFYKVPNDIKINTSKSTTIYLSGNCFNNVNKTAAQIRGYKKPDPYKGKGILYFNEKIKLKPGKKV